MTRETLIVCEDADNLHNKGKRSGTSTGKYEEAISAYNQSLELADLLGTMQMLANRKLR